MITNSTQDLQPRQITRGEGPERYTLRLTLEVGKDGYFVEADKLEPGKALTLRFGDKEVKVSRVEHLYTLVASDFASEAAANYFAELLRATFLVDSLRSRVPIHIYPIQPISDRPSDKSFRDYAQPPPGETGWPKVGEIVLSDGAIDGYQSAIVPEHRKIVRLPQTWFIQLRGWIHDVKPLEEEFKNIAANYDVAALLGDVHLNRAFNCFSSAYTQVVGPVTYQNLVAALERLAAAYLPHTSNAAHQAIDSLLDHLAEIEMDVGLSESETRQLRKRVDGLRNPSIGEAFRKLVTPEVITEACPDISKENAEKLSKRLFYAVRSAIAHEGFIEIPEDYGWTMGYLQQVVPFLLKRAVDAYKNRSAWT